MRKGEQNKYFFPYIPITNLWKYYQTSEFIKIGIKQVKPHLFSFFVFITTKNMQFYILIRHCKSSLLSPAKVIRKKSRGKVQEFLQNQKPRRARGKEGPPLQPALFERPPKKRWKSGFPVLLSGCLQQELGLWTCIHCRCRVFYIQWSSLFRACRAW